MTHFILALFSFSILALFFLSSLCLLSVSLCISLSLLVYLSVSVSIIDILSSVQSEFTYYKHYLYQAYNS